MILYARASKSGQIERGAAGDIFADRADDGRSLETRKRPKLKKAALVAAFRHSSFRHSQMI